MVPHLRSLTGKKKRLAQTGQLLPHYRGMTLISMAPHLRSLIGKKKRLAQTGQLLPHYRGMTLISMAPHSGSLTGKKKGLAQNGQLLLHYRGMTRFPYLGTPRLRRASRQEAMLGRRCAQRQQCKSICLRYCKTWLIETFASNKKRFIV